jgi:two-component system OmpR family sensor kinase
VEVADSGPGLTEEQRARAFERFYRAETARAGRGGGSGLGLAIVASVVAAHGGEVSLHPAEPTGILVRIQLPLEHHRASACDENAPARL